VIVQVYFEAQKYLGRALQVLLPSNEKSKLEEGKSKMRKGILCLVLASLCSLPACSDDELDNDVASLLDGGVTVHVIVSLPQNDAGSSSSSSSGGGG